MRIQQISNTNNQYLYEGLDHNARKTMALWENAGLQLKEAALTADQIQSLFKEIETQATAAGGNRTALGMGKDAIDAVNKAWEDLKTKIQDSGPVKNVDSMYDNAVAKIEAGLGGPDNAVNQVIQKYRKFAKEHPIAQGLIYSALIAAAGISGAGLGGAAVLGLLKMTDKLLQGEKFSSAAYSGAKTGAMAYGASKVGDYVKGKIADKDAYDAMGDAQDLRRQLGNPDIEKGLAADQAFQDRLLGKFPPDQGYTVAAGEGGKSLQVLDATGRKVWQGDIPLKTMDTQTFADLSNAGKMATPGISSGSVSSDAMAGVADTAKAAGKGAVDASADIASKAADVATDVASKPFGAGMAPEYLQRVIDAGGKSGVRFKISPEDAQKALDWQTQNGGQAASAAANAAGNAASGYSADYLQKVINGEVPRAMVSKEKAAELLKGMKGESVVSQGKSLSEGQVYMVFNRVCKLNDALLSEGKLMEGPLDAIKGAAGKAMNWAATKGKNLTTKVTADKLNSAWQKAGSPTDSEELKAFLTQQGVAANVVNGVFKSLNITSSPADAKGAAAPVDIEQVKKLIAALPTDRKARLLKFLQKNAGSSAPATPSRDAGDGRIEPTMA
jgi:hypothetical protein